MVAYLLLCILCVLLALFIGSWALGLWVVGTVAVVAFALMGDLLRLGVKGLDALEDHLAREKGDDPK